MPSSTLAVIKTPKDTSLRSVPTGQAGDKTMTTLTVIKTGGKQYLVSPGQRIKIEKIDQPVGAEVSFDEVLLTSDGQETQLGLPLIKGAQVKGKVLSQDKFKKVVIIKYKAKVRYHKKTGHRQSFTEVEITGIG